MNDFSSLPKEDVFILDPNLVIGYLKDDIPGWREWVNAYVKEGRKLFVHEATLSEVSKLHHPQTPHFIELLKVEDITPPSFLTRVYEEIADLLQIDGTTRIKLQTDIELIAIAGYAAASSPQISDKEIFSDRVVFASSNVNCIECVLGTKEKRAIVEKALDDNGLEHLITVRLITNDQKWKDFN